MIRAVGQASAIESLDPRTRKLLSWSPPVASAQLRTCIGVQGYPLWIPGVVGFGGQLGGQPRGCRTGNLGGIPAGRAARGWFAIADTHSHNAQVHRQEHTHTPRIGGMASSGRTWIPATTRAPPRRRQPFPPGRQGRLVLRIGPVIGGCVAVVPSPSFAPCLGLSWALGFCATGLGSRRAERPNRTMAGT